MLPLSGRIRFRINLIVVVFPAPLGPSSPMIEPGRMTKLTRSSVKPGK